jgi:hypothetical protein
MDGSFAENPYEGLVVGRKKAAEIAGRENERQQELAPLRAASAGEKPCRLASQANSEADVRQAPIRAGYQPAGRDAGDRDPDLKA